MLTPNLIYFASDSMITYNSAMTKLRQNTISYGPMCKSMKQLTAGVTYLINTAVVCTAPVTAVYVSLLTFSNQQIPLRLVHTYLLDT